MTSRQVYAHCRYMRGANAAFMTTDSNPLVSIIVPSYNHAEFILEAVESVLAQSYGRIQVIVVDDGSRDDTRQRLSSVHDDRVETIFLESNAGACNALNVGIEAAHGDYIAILNSDDRWHSAKLETQLKRLSAAPHAAAAFTNAQFVDQRGKPLSEGEIGSRVNIFSQPNRSRPLWLRRFFLEGNCLCHPSILVKRTAYRDLGPYDNRLRQLPDLDMWIRMCKRFEIQVCPEVLVDFRVLDGERNTSAITPVTLRRTWNEHALIADAFFDDMADDDFITGFGDLFVNREARSAAELGIEKAFLYLTGESPLRDIYAPLGFRRLYQALGAPETQQLLRQVYGFGDLQFQEYTSRVAVGVVRS